MRVSSCVSPDKFDILSLDSAELEAMLTEIGLTGYRVRQVKSWLAGVPQSFDSCTVLPKNAREQLSAAFSLPECEIERRQASEDGTVKYLFRLADGSFVESVLMRYQHGNTVCISSQVGCRMGCAFCASGLLGFQRNLLPSELLAQVASVQRDSGERVDGIVMMGTGEPLDNYEASVQFLSTVSSEASLNIGCRHISLSTSGLVNRIRELAELGLQITLSVSLHAPDDETRSRIMPVNRRWGVREVVDAATDYQRRTGRRVSYEYALIRGVNDTPEKANALATLLSGRGAHINLIRLNEVEESPLKPSTRADVKEFMKILAGRGANATLRRRLGADIDGACGQLRAKVTSENKKGGNAI